MVAWFTLSGSAGLIEERRDIYIVDGRPNVGLRYRAEEVLELKLRRSLGSAVTLDAALIGQLETWRKWSPASAVADPRGRSGVVITVDKIITKRAFAFNNGFARAVDLPDRTSSGCDVEVASLEVAGAEASTLAFAAFGPPSERLKAIRASWEALQANDRFPGLSGTTTAAGYPAWLASDSCQAITGAVSSHTR